MRKYILQKGDTIIEVLLAMSVVGLVLGAAFGIANRSVTIGRNAQERSEALKFAESQLELMNEYVDQEFDGSETPTELLFRALDLRSDPASFDGACFVININRVEVAKVQESITSDGDACQQNFYQVYVACMTNPPNDMSAPIDKSNTCLDGSTNPDKRMVVRVVWERLGARSVDVDGDGVLDVARDNLDLFYRYGQ